ncbi:MAG: hypothetical protein ACFFCQ_03010, partial [Promethearchaeota archaeon]
IGEQLWQIDMWVRSTYINTINDEFESYPDDKYYFADKETTGFDLIIEREVWENYLPIRSESIANFLSNNFFPTGTDSEILAYYYTPDYIHAANITQLNLVFLDVTRKIQEEIAILEEDYYKDKTTTERLNMGAILTTVTMILASAMSNRLQDKSTEHSFSVLRGDVLNKKELVILKRDWISIPVLLFSVILAVVGVLIPLIIPYFI